MYESNDINDIFVKAANCFENNEYAIEILRLRGEY